MSELNRNQQEAVKRQQGNLKSFGEALKKEYGDLTPEAVSQKALAAPLVTQLLTKIDEAEKKIAAYLSDLEKNQCPADHPDVAAIQKGLADHKSFLEGMRAALQGAGNKAQEMTDISKYPDFEADVKKLEELADVFKMDGSLVQKPVQEVKDLSERFQAEVDWINALPKKYAPLINLKTPEGLKVQAAHTKAAQSMIAFKGKQDELLTDAEKRFAEQLKMALDTADRAVKDKNPGLFTGQVQRSLEEARLILERVQVVPKDTFKALVQKIQPEFEKSQGELASRKEALKEDIRAATKKPEDNYKGADKADLEKRVREEWTKAYSGDQILGILFPMSDWKRTDYKQWNMTQLAWGYHSYSELSARVVVKTNDTVATIYNVLLVKNHMDNDKVTFDVKQSKDPKGPLVIEEMLMANF